MALRILALDDETPIRQWIEFCIEKMDGFEMVGTAANGEDGLKMYEKTQPDIIITDVRMPKMDGLTMLKEIYKSNPSVFAIVLTSYEDFAYAREALKIGVAEYVLKTEISEEVLISLLQKAHDYFYTTPMADDERHYEQYARKNLFLRSLVMRQSSGYVSVEKLHSYDIHIESSAYIVLDVVDIKNTNEKCENLVSSRLNMPVALRFSLDFSNAFMVLNLESDSSEEAEKQHNELVLRMEKAAEECDCFIAISDIYNEERDLCKSLQQAYLRSSLHFYISEQRVFFNNSTIVSKLQNRAKIKMRFSREMVNQNYTEAYHIIDTVRKNICTKYPTDIGSVKRLYQFFITTIIHTTSEDMGAANSVTKHEEDILAATSYFEIDKMLEDVFKPLQIFASHKKAVSAAVSKAMEYITANYQQQISLTEIAAKVSLSPEYLSRLFKEETGVNFIVYLNNIRMKNAVRLLENSNMKVYEVAQAVGYGNLSYFSTLFKKNFGQNPFEYKNTASRKKE